jgi:ABC-type glycerol-3-phosphate transport system permease component
MVDAPLRRDHFTDIWTDPRMNVGVQSWNTLVYTTARTFLPVPLSAMAAFGLARHRFPGRDLIFWLILPTGTIPHEVMLVPLDLMVKSVPLAGATTCGAQAARAGSTRKRG